MYNAHTREKLYLHLIFFDIYDVKALASTIIPEPTTIRTPQYTATLSQNQAFDLTRLEGPVTGDMRQKEAFNEGHSQRLMHHSFHGHTKKWQQENPAAICSLIITFYQLPISLRNLMRTRRISSSV